MAAPYEQRKERWSPWRAAVYGLVLALIVYSFLSLGLGDEDLSTPSALELGEGAGLVVFGPVIFLLIAVVRNHFVEKQR